MLVAQAPRRRLAALPSNAHNKQRHDVCGGGRVVMCVVLKVFCCWYFGRWLRINSDMGFLDFRTLGT